MRILKLILCVVMIAVALQGCAPVPPPEPVEQFEDLPQNLGPATPTPLPTTTPVFEMPSQGEGVFDANPYDEFIEATATSLPAPLLEEEVDYTLDSQPDYGYATGNSQYLYAGSTPIPLDPVDMPEATLVPMNTVYTLYDTSLGLSFEGPAGWIPTNNLNEMFVLTEPTNETKDDYTAVITITSSPVNSTYTEKELKKEVLQRLETISQTNYIQWEPSLTANRTLLDGRGVYANYKGTMTTGIKVGGRIHYASKDRMLYSIEITYPLAYRNAYEDIYTKIRNTISLTY